MRRFFAVLSFVLAVALLGGCTPSPGVSLPAQSAPADVSVEGAAPSAGAELALISTEERAATAFGQAVWSSISRFAGEHSLTSASYRTEPNDPEAALATLDLALTGGATLVVAMDEEVCRAIADAKSRAPGVQYVLVDAPADAVAAADTAVLRWSEVQAGWLYGYLAVFEDARPLVLAVYNDESSRRFAAGVLWGAEAAAAELARPEQSVDVRLVWLNGQEDAGVWRQELDAALAAPGGQPPLPESEDTTQEDATAGPLVILPGGPAQGEALGAAQAAGGGLFGAEMELASMNMAVLASLWFEAGGLVYSALEDWLDGRFPGGEEIVGGVDDGAIRLEVEPERFANLAQTRVSMALARYHGGTLAAGLNARAAQLDELFADVDTPLSTDALNLTLVALGGPREDAGAGPDGSTGASMAESTSEAGIP